MTSLPKDYLLEIEPRIRERLWGHGSLRYMCVTGSHAYGMSNPDSDIDVRVVYSAPAERFLGVGRGMTDRQMGVEGGIDGIDFTAFEMSKFFKLGLDCNPNILEWWFADSGAVEPIWIDNEAEEMMKKVRAEILNPKLVVTKFVGFGNGQRQKLSKLRTGDPRWAKLLRHGLRVLWNAVDILELGYLNVHVNKMRQSYLRSTAIWETQTAIDEMERVIQMIKSLPQHDYDSEHVWELADKLLVGDRKARIH